MGTATETLIEDTPTNVTVERTIRVWPHDATLVQQALTARTDDLDKLAKKLDDEGYGKEADKVRRDVSALKTDVLPQLVAQHVLPFPRRSLDDAVASIIGRTVKRFVLAQKNAAKTGDPTTLDEAWLIGTLANWVTLAVEAAAAEGLAEGQRNRERTPAFIGQVAVADLKDPAEVDG